MKKILIILILGLLVSCGPSREEIEKQANVIKTQYNTSQLNNDELIQYTSLKICGCDNEKMKTLEAKLLPLNEIVEPQSEVAKPVTTTYSKFSSLETGLPTGTVVALDNSEEDMKNNYVTIKDYNGFSKIIRDVDVDLYLNLHEGDIIE